MFTRPKEKALRQNSKKNNLNNRWIIQENWNKIISSEPSSTLFLKIITQSYTDPSIFSYFVKRPCLILLSPKNWKTKFYVLSSNFFLAEFCAKFACNFSYFIVHLGLHCNWVDELCSREMKSFPQVQHVADKGGGFSGTTRRQLTRSSFLRVAQGQNNCFIFISFQLNPNPYLLFPYTKNPREIVRATFRFSLRERERENHFPFEKAIHTSFFSLLLPSRYWHINERRLYQSPSSPYLSVARFLDLGSNGAIPQIKGDLRSLQSTA